MRILVQPKAGVEPDQFAKILKTNGATSTKHLHQINVYVVELAESPGALEKLARNPKINFAEIDQPCEPVLIVDDPLYPSQWHLPNIGAPFAWDQSTGDGVIIAILDTGTDSNHPDLAPNILPGWNAYDNNSDTHDVYGHGTMTAGTAAAAGNNGIGVCGVAPGAKILPIRISDTAGYGYYSTMASGINWAADHGARVASISFLGVTGSSAVISAAQYMRSKGGVVVAASGNSGAVDSYPATDFITSVGAIDWTNSLAWFSSQGDYVDCVAPGQDIYTTTNGGGFSSVSGTSFSCPVVAGVYALMISANPQLSPADLDSILFTTAKDGGTEGKDIAFGWGAVDAPAAVARALETVSENDTIPPTVSILTPRDGSTVSGTVLVSASATDNDSVVQIGLTIDGKQVATGFGPELSYQWNTAATRAKPVKPPGKPPRPRNSTLVVTAKDPSGNIGKQSITVRTG